MSVEYMFCYRGKWKNESCETDGGKEGQDPRLGVCNDRLTRTK